MVWKQLRELNQDHCYLLVSEYKYKYSCPRIDEVKTWESLNQKLLGVVIKRNLWFNEFASSLCEKANRKLSVL